MPRKPVVSRTMTVTKAIVLCVDPGAEETIEKHILLPREYSTEEKLLKAAKSAVEPGIRVVCVKSARIGKLRFIMSEQEFINKAAIAEIIY